jgi:hypothetical protein
VAPEPPQVSPLVLENFEDGNDSLLANDGRNGYWFSDASTDGTMTPFEVVEVMNERMPNSTRGIHIVASGFGTDGWALLGVELNGGEAYPGAAAYSGITFWGRHGGTEGAIFRIKFPTTSTAEDDDDFGMSLEAGAEWVQYLIPFNEMNLKQLGFGTEQAFDAAELLGIQFSLAQGTMGFDVWVDDIRFVM